MRRLVVVLLLTLALPSCTSFRGAAGSDYPESVEGKWAFRTSSSGVAPVLVELKHRRAQACLSGDWREARWLGPGPEGDSPVVYEHSQDGRLRLLLNADFCDVYSIYTGQIVDGSFKGEHITLTMAGVVEHGAIFGERSE